MTLLEEFDQNSGIQKMRDMVKVFSNCNETFLNRYRIQELIKIYRMWLKSEWNFYPNKWTERQVREALRNQAPMWDINGKPVYAKRIPKNPDRA